MKEDEFNNLLDNLSYLTPEQLEQVFVTLHQRFRSRMSKKDMDYAALAWRCKQAYQIVQYRKPTPVASA